MLLHCVGKASPYGGAAMADLSKRHVVIVPHVFQSPLPPMLHLAKSIATTGLIVTLITVESIHSKLLKHCKFDSGIDLRLHAVPFDLDCPNGINGSILFDPQAVVAYVEALKKLPQSLKRVIETLTPKPFCVISDSLLNGIQDIVDGLGIHRVAFFPGSASYFALESNVSLLQSKNHIPVTEAHWLDQKVSIDYISGVRPLHPRDLPDYFRCEMAMAAVKAAVERSHEMDRADWILINSFEALEPQVLANVKKTSNGRVISIAPLFDESASSSGISAGRLQHEDDQCLLWLDNQVSSSVIYISFGSIARISADQFEELALGLEATEVPFVWVVSQHLVADQDRACIDAFKSRLSISNQGIMVSWAPQMQVLAHPAIGAFVTHCGWSSIFENICIGNAPILGWPCLAEQSLNCTMAVEEWGVGARLKEITEFSFEWGLNPEKVGVVKRTEIKQRILQSMQKSEEMAQVRENLKKFREEARKAVMEGGSSYSNLHSFLYWVAHASN